MDDHSPIAQDDESRIFMATVPSDVFDEWVTRRDAYKWALQIVRKAIHDANASWEGELRSVFALRQTVAGTLLKLRFIGVPESLMTAVVLPGFESVCQIKRMTKDEMV